MERAKEMLSAAEGNLEIGQYKTSLNRSYYAIFHAMRAMNILKGFDSSKHSGVIAYFNKEYRKQRLRGGYNNLPLIFCMFLGGKENGRSKRRISQKGRKYKR